MQNNATVKTKLVRSRLQQVILLCCAVLLVVILALVRSTETTKLTLAGKTITLEVANSEKAREQGLSGRTSLAVDRGMLFSYNDSGVRCFWMRDMHFPLDIVWLNARKDIVWIEDNATPTSYPHQFCPQYQAQYVIELNAGMAQTLNLAIGQELPF